MVLRKLIKVLLVGTRDAFPVAEDALSSLKCVDVTDVALEDHHFLIEGWMPQMWFDDLRYILEQASGDEITLLWDETVVPAVITAPVLLENPRFVKPFEQIVRLFSLPGRDGFDPTLLTFLTLPLFFGFVIGDIGYGVVFVILGMLVRRWFRTPLGELAASFLIFGGVWSVVFGAVLFADIFGFVVTVGPLQYHLLDKIHDIPTLLILSLIIGFVHINLGVGIGAMYERRRAGLKAAFLRKLSWYILEAGFILFGIGALGILSDVLWIPGLALAAFAVALISLGGGLVDVVEVPSFFGNIMSYLRLGILGVVKGVLSVVINLVVVDGLLPLGIGGWILGSIIFVVGHGFTMGLALITVSVHALRLHYVEFYTKFYPVEAIGTSRAFEPSLKLPQT